MRTSEVLNLAADLIEERGWAKGNCGMSVDGPLCLEGALGAALGSKVLRYEGHGVTERDLKHGQDFYSYGDVEISAPYMAVVAYLDSFHRPWGWNDDQADAEPVIELLRACALIEASREEQAAVWETYAELVVA